MSAFSVIIGSLISSLNFYVPASDQIQKYSLLHEEDAVKWSHRVLGISKSSFLISEPEPNSRENQCQFERKKNTDRYWITAEELMMFWITSMWYRFPDSWMVKVVRLSDLAHNRNLNSDRLLSQSIQGCVDSMLRLQETYSALCSDPLDFISNVNTN